MNSNNVLDTFPYIKGTIGQCAWKLGHRDPQFRVAFLHADTDSIGSTTSS